MKRTVSRRTRHRTGARWCCVRRNWRRSPTIRTRGRSMYTPLPGPGAGPNGGQIYIDGFTGGNLPNKSSIREVRINSNPFSPEYERPGFGRIEILTKPGTDTLHGQAFGQYNKEALNSRSPLLTSSTRPDYRQEFFGVSLTGPIKKGKATSTAEA